MIYKLTKKGILMWPGRNLKQSEVGPFALKVVFNSITPDIWISSSPLEIEALIRLGLIEEIL